MKKIIFLLPLILMASCGNNVVQNNRGKENILNAQTVENQQSIQEETKKSIKEIEEQVDIHNRDNHTKSESDFNLQSLQLLEQKKLKKFVSLKSGLYFYWLDCHKLFKLPENIKKCEKWWLKEAAIACNNKRYFKWMTPDQIFSKKKFDLLSNEEIQQAKQQCLNIIKQEQEEQKQIKLKQKKLKKYYELIDNFKVWDCEKMFKNKIFVNQCRISFAIKKWNCNLLDDSKLKKECKIAKKYIEQYKLMQKYNKEYWDFTGFVWNKIKQELRLDE